MAAVSTIIAGAALAVGAGSAYNSYRQGKKAAKAQDKQQDMQRAQANSAAASKSRQAVRSGRIARAKALQGGMNMGLAGSSTVSGRVSDIQNQTGMSLADTAGGNMIAQRNMDFQTQQRHAQTRQANWNSLTQLSGSVFNAAGGFGSLQAGYDRAMGNTKQSMNTVAEIKGGQHDGSIFK